MNSCNHTILPENPAADGRSAVERLRDSFLDDPDHSPDRLYDLVRAIVAEEISAELFPTARLFTILSSLRGRRREFLLSLLSAPLESYSRLATQTGTRKQYFCRVLRAIASRHEEIARILDLRENYASTIGKNNSLWRYNARRRRMKEG